MMKTKPFLLIFFLLLTLTSATCLAAKNPPRRIALVPAFTETGMRSLEAEKYCDQALYDSLRVPLNNVLKFHEYISAEEILTALPELKDKKKGTILLPSRLKEAAEPLSADLIVGFIINDAGEYRSHNWDGDTILYSYVTVSLIGYDRQKDAFIKLKRQTFYHDDESVHGYIPALTKQVVDRLLQDADFKKDIFPLSGKDVT